jgi:hypothetical protein
MTTICLPPAPSVTLTYLELCRRFNEEPVPSSPARQKQIDSWRALYYMTYTSGRRYELRQKDHSPLPAFLTDPLPPLTSAEQTIMKAKLTALPKPPKEPKPPKAYPSTYSTFVDSPADYYTRPLKHVGYRSISHTPVRSPYICPSCSTPLWHVTAHQVFATDAYEDQYLWHCPTCFLRFYEAPFHCLPTQPIQTGDLK